MDRNARILIAEDDDGHFTLIRRNLIRAGIVNETTRFCDGQAAMDFLNGVRRQGLLAKQYFLLLLDLRMPKLNGLEVLRAMKSDTLLRRIPVIVLSTASTDEDINECHEYGCCMYLVKPVEYSRFVEMIQTVGAFLSILEIPSLQSAGDCVECREENA